MLIVALVLILAGAIALIALGVRRQRRAAAVEGLTNRMGQFATREEMLAESGPVKSKERGNVLARRLEDVTQGGSAAGRASGLLARADAKLTVGEYLLLRAGVGVGGVALAFLLFSGAPVALRVLLGIVFGFVGSILPAIYFSRKARQREKLFIEQLGDTISLMGNSLRAGYSLLQTMEMVSHESPDPIGKEFGRVVREVGLGISNEEALQNLLRRIPSPDLDLLVTAINIQHEVGDNLAQILAIIGQTIRDRVKIKGDIAVLTAQQQMSTYVISGLPVLPGLGMLAINRDYMLQMFSGPWLCMPIGAVVLALIGFFVMKKITAIEV